MARGELESGSFARRRWGLKDTLYFNLMTGRFADQARAVGDVFAMVPPLGLRRGSSTVRGAVGHALRPVAGAAGAAFALLPSVRRRSRARRAARRREAELSDGAKQPPVL